MAVIAKIPPLETNLAHAVSNFRFKQHNFSQDAILNSIAAAASSTRLLADRHATVTQENSTSPSIKFHPLLETATVPLLLLTKHKEFAIAVFLITFTSK